MSHSSLPFNKVLSSGLYFFSFFLLLGIFFSTALISLSEFLILIISVIIFLKKPKKLLKEILDCRICLTAVLLLSLIIIQIFISPATYQIAIEQAARYRELLLLILLIMFLGSSERKKVIYYTFVLGMTLILAHTYLQVVGLVKNPSAFVSPEEMNTSILGRIAGAIMLAFTCFIYLEEALKHKTRLFIFSIWLMLFILGSIAVLFFYQGRTGIVVYLSILLFFGFRFWRWKGLFLSIVIGSIFFVFAFHNSESFKNRYTQTKQEMVNLFQFSNFDGHDISRAGRTKVAIHLIDTKKILIGHGTGSLAYYVEKNGFDHININPHNQYLLLLYENGIIGFLLWIFLLIYIWKMSQGLPQYEARVVKYLVITFAVASLFNSLLMDNKEAHFFVLILASLITKSKKIKV